jgi:hypothetical protein
LDCDGERVPTDLELKFAAAMDLIGEHLASLGFKRRRQSFRKHVGPNIMILEFQRSSTNNEGRLRFTLNLAIISAAVAACEDQDIRKLSASEGHLRERIGGLTGEGDKWWLIDSGTDTDALTHEIAASIRSNVLPFLDSHSTDADLKTLWESGRSPGLTEKQRRRYLDALTR